MEIKTEVLVVSTQVKTSRLLCQVFSVSLPLARWFPAYGSSFVQCGLSTVWDHHTQVPKSKSYYVGSIDFWLLRHRYTQYTQCGLCILHKIITHTRTNKKTLKDAAVLFFALRVSVVKTAVEYEGAGKAYGQVSQLPLDLWTLVFRLLLYSSQLQASEKLWNKLNCFFSSLVAVGAGQSKTLFHCLLACFYIKHVHKACGDRW